MKKIINKENKKGQEEIVGFVLIIVLVAVAFLVFLGIAIRNGGPSTSSESSDIYQFLESSMEFTTECAFSSVPDYFTLGELFEECYTGNNCLNDKNSCDVLDETLKEILKGSLNVDPEANIKGYEFESFYSVDSSDSEQREEIISFKEGDCTGPIRGASYLSPAFPGRIESVLRVCS
jgi:hypothetical protein